LTEWTFDRKRIFANCNLNPNSSTNPKAQKALPKTKWGHFSSKWPQDTFKGYSSLVDVAAKVQLRFKSLKYKVSFV